MNLGEVWREVKREEIVDIKFGKYCFRDYLVKTVKNNQQKNTILLNLEKFFNFMIMSELAEGGELRSNPVLKSYDKFETKTKVGTGRKVIPVKVIELMKRVLSSEDFSWSKDNFKEDEMCGGDHLYSTSYILYFMLSLPLRSMQVRWLDSGYGDEFSYDFGSRDMFKNLRGEKGRREGLVRKSFYNGVMKEAMECFYVNTNKSGLGFEIPWVSLELLNIVEKQKKFLERSRLNKMVSKEYGVKNSLRVYPLFMDGVSGGVVSREKLMRLWIKLCLYVEKNYGVALSCLENEKRKLIYDLHSLRVSGITNAMEVLQDERMVGVNWSGQTDLLVLHYTRVEDLKSLVRGQEELKQLGFSVKLLPQK